jgi:hypothetical protein
MAVETGKGKAPVNTKAQPSVEVKAIELKPLEFRFLRETVNTLVFSEMLPSGAQYDPSVKQPKGTPREHVVGTLYVDKTAGFTPDSIIEVKLTDLA